MGLLKLNLGYLCNDARKFSMLDASNCSNVKELLDSIRSTFVIPACKYVLLLVSNICVLGGKSCCLIWFSKTIMICLQSIDVYLPGDPSANVQLALFQGEFFLPELTPCPVLREDLTYRCVCVSHFIYLIFWFDKEMTHRTIFMDQPGWLMAIHLLKLGFVYYMPGVLKDIYCNRVKVFFSRWNFFDYVSKPSSEKLQ